MNSEGTGKNWKVRGIFKKHFYYLKCVQDGMEIRGSVRFVVIAISRGKVRIFELYNRDWQKFHGFIFGESRKVIFFGKEATFERRDIFRGIRNLFWGEK